jgi:hypothetical protein
MEERKDGHYVKFKLSADEAETLGRTGNSVWLCGEEKQSNGGYTLRFITKVGADNFRTSAQEAGISINKK